MKNHGNSSVSGYNRRQIGLLLGLPGYNAIGACWIFLPNRAQTFSAMIIRGTFHYVTSKHDDIVQQIPGLHSLQRTASFRGGIVGERRHEEMPLRRLTRQNVGSELFLPPRSRDLRMPECVEHQRSQPDDISQKHYLKRLLVMMVALQLSPKQPRLLW